MENWRIHINGLKQMVELRGGIQAFDSKRMVRNKIHRYAPPPPDTSTTLALIENSADLCGSTDLVQKPVFEFHRESPTIAGSHSGKFNGIKDVFELDVRLAKIIRQLHDITLNMNLIHLKSADIHPLSLREDITSLQYSLLSLDFTSDDTQVGVQHRINGTVQLAHLMYLVSILDEYLPGSSICDGLGQRLASQLETLPAREHFTDEFLLWVAFCGASIVTDAQNRMAFQTLAMECRKDLGLISWDDAVAIFQSFFWVKEIHGKTFRRVWRVLELMES